MATSHLLLYMIWAPPRHTDLLKKKAIWIGTGRKQSQNCPRSVETGFPWRPHKSSKRHVMTDGACITIPFESETDCIAPQPMLLQNCSRGLGNPEKDG